MIHFILSALTAATGTDEPSQIRLAGDHVMADFGNYALMVGLALAIFGTLTALIAALTARERFRKATVRAFLAMTLMIFCAVFALGYLLQHDAFQVVYVQSHSNRHLPWIYKLTAIWGGSQGSLLWWTTILAVYNLFFLFFIRKAPRLMTAWALFFVGICLTFFLVINNIVSNPFQIWGEDIAGMWKAVDPRDGAGLNPQLQHWAMIIHPPMLYLGYIGFLFPFALTMGALITRLDGRDWLPMIRNWTLVAWLILGVGIVLGGAWAYMELGWGGYWAWDPVENASFMPWLLATAFLHSIMAQEKRGMFKMWNVLLLVSSFLMCMFGTFITRSGLISSVHAFAESDIGNYFIGYIVLNAVLSGIVVIARRDQLADDNQYESMTSREVSLLFNNVLFAALCLLTLLGTVWPMITEALIQQKQELRHGYYNQVMLPIFIGLMLLMAIGPILTWKKTTGRQARERFMLPSIAMVVVFVLCLALSSGPLISSISFAVLAFLLVTIVEEFWIAGRRRAKRAGENMAVAIYNLIAMNRRRYGGYITHFSVLLMGLGITGAAFNHQDKMELGIGETMEVGGFLFQVENIRTEDNVNYVAYIADVNLMKNGRPVERFAPEQRFYKASQSQASEVDIHVGWLRDYYVVVAGPAPQHTDEHPIGVFHIYVNPLVIWIWIGTILMVVGTMVALLPQRSRRKVKAAVPANMEAA
ncbi:heme lyase CcmF/NrfE family subunit [Acanthopleuribacter pedis]|uniref:Heme lyase CcmF/NrfE family subunit n=1 Tax=Acanthopleuribacter pedis TaxID=442870 RepID=A0A8J7QAY3_9BACT|nr:heme lyase CcmF/NrfE family subunit [Acanthopleuribacter pedis]MBO1322141.1 heme lyase CcmF/NrfE family subunit [Acanthopleuribacter pedis]